MMDLRPLADILNHFARIYAMNSKENKRDYDLCKRYARISQQIVNGIPIVFIMVATLYLLGAVHEGIMSDVVKPPCNIYFPLLDQAGLLGVILTDLLNVVFAYAAAIAIIPFEMITYLVFANVKLSSMVIERDLVDFRVVLENPDTTGHEIKSQLFEIILMDYKHNE